MRALKIGIIMLLVIILLISCGISFLHGFTNDFNIILKEAQDKYNSNDREGALQKIDESSAFLDKYHDILCIILDHSDVTEAQVSLLKLTVFAKSDEDEYFNAECNALMSRVDNMYSSEKLNIANVF